MASNSEGIKQYSNSAGSSANGTSLGQWRGSQPHNNMPPYLCVNFVIALQGIFPSSKLDEENEKQNNKSCKFLEKIY